MFLSLVAYLVTLFVFAGVDMIWLTWVGGPAYRATLGDVLLQDVRVGPAIAFYLVYAVGLAAFAVLPSLGDSPMSQTLLRGAQFGFFTYATYDLTNLATLKNWTLTVTLMDIGWGCALGAIVAAAAAALTTVIVTHLGGSIS